MVLPCQIFLGCSSTSQCNYQMLIGDYDIDKTLMLMLINLDILGFITISFIYWSLRPFGDNVVIVILKILVLLHYFAIVRI